MITRTLSETELFSSSLSEMGDIGYDEEDASHIDQLWGIHDKLNKLRGKIIFIKNLKLETNLISILCNII